MGFCATHWAATDRALKAHSLKLLALAPILLPICLRCWHLSLWAHSVSRHANKAWTREKVREDHYPAPFRLIDLFERYGGSPDRMKREETKAFAPLMVSIDPFSLQVRASRLWGDTAMTWLYDLHYALLLDRGVDTAVGCLVGLAVLFVTSQRGGGELRAAMGATRSSNGPNDVRTSRVNASNSVPVGNPNHVSCG